MHIHAEDKAARRIKTVLLNGADVTNITHELDTNEGWVNLIMRSADGKVVIKPDGTAATLKIYGRVVVAFNITHKCTVCGLGFYSAAEWARHITTPHLSVG